MQLYKISEYTKINKLKEELTGKLQKHDIILYKSKSPLAPIIHTFIGNPHTHAAVVYDPDNLIILEANKMIAPSLVYSWDSFTILRMKEELTDAQLEKMNKFALEQLGKPYDSLNLFSIAINKLRKKLNMKPKPYGKKDEQFFICSEYVDRIYNIAGISLLNVPSYIAEPDDFLYSDKLEKIIEVNNLEITYLGV